MDEGFSPVIFLYGMAFVLAVGKAFTLMIWRTLPKPRPPLTHEMLEAWKRRKLRTQAVRSPPCEQQGQPTADRALSTDDNAIANAHAPDRSAPRPVMSNSGIHQRLAKDRARRRSLARSSVI